MDSPNGRQGRTSHTDIAAEPERGEKPTHPHVQATLLMLGIVVFLVLVAALEVR